MTPEAPEPQLHDVVGAFGRMPERIEAIASGQVNRHWLVVAAGERLVLREYAAPRSVAAIEYEHVALARAAEKGWPVARPLPAQTGAAVVECGVARYALFRWLGGDPPQGHVKAYPRVVGRLLARFTVDMEGSWAEGQRDGFGRVWELDIPVRAAGGESFNGLLAEFGRTHPELAAPIRTHRYRNLRALARLGYGELPSTFVHGDFQRENLLFTGAELSGLLDFDSCRQDARVVDLAATVWLDCPKSPDYDAIDVPAARDVVESYVRRVRLSEEELALLPELIRAHMLWFVTFRLTQWRNGDERAVASIARTVERRFPALERIREPLRDAVIRLTEAVTD